MRTIITTIAVLLLLSTAVFAGSTATQTFNVAINEINELTVSGNPAGMTINSATAGSEPNYKIDQSTTYSLTTNGTNKKLTAQITTGGSMPANMILRVYLESTAVGTSAGWVWLYANSAYNIMTAISKVTTSDPVHESIAYVLESTASAGTLTNTSKTITFTLCAM